ncbi:MAG: hypothetical protein KDK76_05705 [Chlamydiia bacterium]|nr:hypothetical protein [Chlamydiia bacterium]
MKRVFLFLTILIGLVTGCSHRQSHHQEKLTSIQIIDRNGIRETISSLDRLSLFEGTNFLAPQPYERVIRMFGRSENGTTHSKITTYHDNGEIWQYLEIRNGRACGVYREWHDNGQLRLDVIVIEGLGDLSENAQKGWIFDGVSKAWDSMGRLQAEIYYEKGKLQGNSIYYHPNGKVRMLIPYENDLIDGDLLYYNESEQVIGKTPYFCGKRNGIATFRGDKKQPPYSEEYQNDLLINATYHDFSGKMIACIEKGEGKQAIFIEGVLHSIQEYRRGVPEGEVQLFNKRGQLTTLFHTKEGMKHGAEWVYYTHFENVDPQPKLYIEWVQDGIQGICRTWYTSGVLESEREIRDNKKHGICSAWYDDGSLMMMEEYEKDQLVRGTYMKRGEKNPVSRVDHGEGTATLYDSEGHFIKRVLYQKGQPVDEM